MRLKVLIPALIVLLMALMIVFWRHSSQPKHDMQSATETIAQPNSSNGESPKDQRNNSVAAQSAVPFIATSTPVAISSPNAIDRNSPEAIRKYMESQNVPVDFFGEVIDQDGNPLAGARVQGGVLNAVVIAPVPGGAQDKNIPIDQKTDSGGRFEIRDVLGRALQIESIQKDGYEVEPGYCPHSFGASVGDYSNPAIFKMWRSDIHEQLVVGEKKFQIIPDGRPYFIDLMKGEISQTENGDLKVWIKYPEQTVVGDQIYDWRCEVDVVSGGLCQSDSYSMFFAPTDGYVPTFQLQQNIKSGERGSIGNQKFYVNLRNGRIYGRIQLDLITPYNSETPGLIRLSYAINPSGSRILR
jgi:hypothetical protein